MNPPSSILPQTVLESIQNPLIIKNECGVILSCNQVFKDLNNLGSSKVIGSTAYEFLPIKEAEIHTQADIALIASEKTHLNYLITTTTQDSKKLILNVHKSVSYDENGSIQILVVINKPAQLSVPLNNYTLSPRESSVLKLLVRGCSQKQIAATLGISHHTVADYLKSIYAKLGVNSRTQAQLKGILDLGLR